MTSPLAIYAFTSGELSPTLHNRTDLEKYDLGLAIAQNWFVDYRGGISTRPGLQFVDYIQDDDKEVVSFDFAFSDTIENNALLLFSDLKIRFVQDGGYLLESDVTITDITQASPGVVTAVAHGYANGDWVYIYEVVGMTEVNGRLFQVANKTTDTFELLTPFGENFSTSGATAYSSAGVANRVYTITSPYAAADLPKLRAYARGDTVRLTHPDYAIRNLVRSGEVSWAISAESFEPSVSAPTGVTAAASTSGNAGVAFAVTAVGEDDEESLVSDIFLLTSAVQYNTTAGSANVTWTKVAGAKYYNIYRSNITRDDANLHKGMQLGFLGKSFAPSFVDDNVTPDFTRAPPTHRNPFADGAITAIEVTAGGTSYPQDATTVSMAGGGSGFSGIVIVNGAGAVIGVKIINPGSGYTSPVPTITGSGGSGATATATAGDSTGNYPAISTIFQQRQVYAASDNAPLTVHGSRPGLLSNMDVSETTTDDDAFEFELDSDQSIPIRHLIPTRSGLLMFASNGVFQLKTADGTAVSPSNALSDPESYTGTSDVPPLLIDTDILYVEDQGSTVRLLTYTDQSKVFSGTDMSILSNHLLKPTNTIKSWDFQREPFKLVHAAREDGVILAFTIVPEQNVFAWTRYTTKGLFQRTRTIKEGVRNKTYCIVKRYINGRWTKFIESFADREYDSVEDAFCVDCGLTVTVNKPVATLTPASASGTGVAFTASASVFVVGDVGKVIRVGGGKAVITAYVSATEVTCTITRVISKVIPEDTSNQPLPAVSGEWSMDEEITEVTGLWHLEGQAVSILADGSVVEGKTVTNGTLTLDVAASRITVGLPYTCTAKTLPLTAGNIIIEGKRKRVVGTAVRIHETRGLEHGDELTSMYEMKDRTDEDYGQPIGLRTANQTQLIDARFDENGQTFFRQAYPLPATILGLVHEVDLGDD